MFDASRCPWNRLGDGPQRCRRPLSVAGRNRPRRAVHRFNRRTNAQHWSCGPISLFPRMDRDMLRTRRQATAWSSSDDSAFSADDDGGRAHGGCRRRRARRIARRARMLKSGRLAGSVVVGRRAGDIDARAEMPRIVAGRSVSIVEWSRRRKVQQLMRLGITERCRLRWFALGENVQYAGTRGAFARSHTERVRDTAWCRHRPRRRSQRRGAPAPPCRSPLLIATNRGLTARRSSRLPMSQRRAEHLGAWSDYRRRARRFTDVADARVKPSRRSDRQ